MNNQSSKITKFSDIRAGMVVRPINGNCERGGIISRVDEMDKSFMFGAQWGWHFELGERWEIIDTALDLPTKDIGRMREINPRHTLYPFIEEVAAISVYDDTTHLAPADYRSMLGIAFMNDDKEWFAELEEKSKGDVAE